VLECKFNYDLLRNLLVNIFAIFRKNEYLLMFDTQNICYVEAI
jgi:hypothetical protein